MMANTNASEITTNTSGIDDTINIGSLRLDARYQGDSLIQRVKEILQLDSIKEWSVIDSFENLALVHYNEDEDEKVDMNLYGHLRGILVDTEAGAVVASSYGYTPTAIMDKLEMENGTLTITDNQSNVHVFDEMMIKRAFEGVVIRVIWHKGRAFHLSHRKINPRRSRWGTSSDFLSMYYEAGGPSDEQLFDITKPYSDTCYTFLVVHPSLLVATRQKVDRPYIVFLSQQKMELNRPLEEVGTGCASFVTNSCINGIVPESFIHEPSTLSLEEANNHLRYGYFNAFDTEDPRQLTGEAVIIYRILDGVVSDIVKVHSTSYEWRCTIRGNNPNIVHQFYSLLNMVFPDTQKDPQAWEHLKNKLIMFPLYDVQSLKELFNQNQCILTIPSGTINKQHYNNRDARIHLLWLNYVLSLPLSCQEQGLDILTNFFETRKAVWTWIQSIESNKRIDLEKSEYSVRVKNIISTARKFSKDRVAAGKNYSKAGTYMKLSVLIKSTIRNLINKENGTSLYSLAKEMKQSQKSLNSNIPPVLPTNSVQ